MAIYPGDDCKAAYNGKKLNYTGIGGNDVKSICNKIINRADDLKKTADKIRAIMEDLDAGNTLVVNGSRYGQHIEEIATKLESLYQGLIDAAEAADASGKACRAEQDEKARRYQSYLNKLWQEEQEKAQQQAASSYAANSGGNTGGSGPNNTTYNSMY